MYAVARKLASSDEDLLRRNAVQAKKTIKALSERRLTDRRTLLISVLNLFLGARSAGTVWPEFQKKWNIITYARKWVTD